MLLDIAGGLLRKSRPADGAAAVESMPGLYLRAAANAIAAFNRDDGWAIASHVALSGVIALFPFLIFCASLAAYLDLGQFADTVIHLVFDIWPAAAAKPLAEEIRVVLTVPRGDVLTFGALVSLFFASSGVEAVRLGLNRAYKARETRPYALVRLQGLAFVLVAAAASATIAFLLVFAPLAFDLAHRLAPQMSDRLARFDSWRLGISAAVLVAALFASHRWLPAGRRRLGEIAPGILATLAAWWAASQGFALYLKGFANYVGTYAGLAGIMAALVFVYLMACIFLLGGEFNAALMASRNGAAAARGG
jgi:membrane protein